MTPEIDIGVVITDDQVGKVCIMAQACCIYWILDIKLTLNFKEFQHLSQYDKV